MRVRADESKRTKTEACSLKKFPCREAIETKRESPSPLRGDAVEVLFEQLSSTETVFCPSGQENSMKHNIYANDGKWTVVGSIERTYCTLCGECEVVTESGGKFYFSRSNRTVTSSPHAIITAADLKSDLPSANKIRHKDGCVRLISFPSDSWSRGAGW